MTGILLCGCTRWSYLRMCDLCFFFFNDTATTEIYTLSLHDALPIPRWRPRTGSPVRTPYARRAPGHACVHPTTRRRPTPRPVAVCARRAGATETRPGWPRSMPAADRCTGVPARPPARPAPRRPILPRRHCAQPARGSGRRYPAATRARRSCPLPGPECPSAQRPPGRAERPAHRVPEATRPARPPRPPRGVAPRGPGAGGRRDRRSRRHLPRRQADRESRALPHRALHLEMASVRFGQLAHDGQAETGTRLSAVGLVELVEDARQRLGRDAAAAIGHRHPQLVTSAVAFDPDGCAGRGVLDAVGQQVRKDLTHPVLVPHHQRSVAFPGKVDADVALLGNATQSLCDLLDAVAEREHLRRHAQLAGLRPRQLEQILDQVGESLALAVDHVQPIGLDRIVLGSAERVDVPLDYDQRSIARTYG